MIFSLRRRRLLDGGGGSLDAGGHPSPDGGGGFLDGGGHPLDGEGGGGPEPNPLECDGGCVEERRAGGG